MRVVVTGATGNVGSAVMRALVADPAVDEVVAVARRAPDPGVQPYTNGKVEWRSADVGVDDLDDVVAGAEVVIHLAWRFQPTRDRTVTWHSNVIGTERVLAAVARTGVGAFVHASSIGTYAPPPADDSPVDETWSTQAIPAAAYGIEKSHLERVLDVYESEHPEVRVVRTRSAFVFQRSAAPEQLRIFGGRLVPGRLIGSRRLPAVPVPKGLRFQVVHADDLADFYVAAVLHPVRGAFNVAADPVVDQHVLADALGAKVVEVPPRAARWALSAAFHSRLVPTEPGLLDLFMSLPVMSVDRARRELAWSPRHDAAATLAELLDGLRHPDGAPTPPLDT